MHAAHNPNCWRACVAPRRGCSIPQRYAHAQTELQAAKQVWARRSELPLSEVRAARGAATPQRQCTATAPGVLLRARVAAQRAM
jgi:hypothetical protein